MSTREIRIIASKIEAIITEEKNVNLTDLTKKINADDKTILIAIGYLISEDKIYLFDIDTKNNELLLSHKFIAF